VPFTDALVAAQLDIGGLDRLVLVVAAGVGLVIARRSPPPSRR
jgi:hypothetical protein